MSRTLDILDNFTNLAVLTDRFASQLQENLGFSARFYQAIAVVLADRLRDRFQQRGYGGNAHETEESLDFDLEYADELDMDTLEKTAIAGSRFDWFLKQAKSRT